MISHSSHRSQEIKLKNVKYKKNQRKITIKINKHDYNKNQN